MANSAMLKAKGLYTFQNFLSFIPEGSLLDATNVVIDRDGIIEPRRGIKQYGTFGITNDIAKQLLTYKTQVLVHYGNTIAFDNGSGIFTNFDNVYNSVVEGLRIKSVEFNGNLYITTNDGIKKIASDSTDLSTALETDAGGIKALDGTAVVDYSNAGFLTGLSEVAYRIVWGTTDVNKNLILGSPSSRIVVTNFSTASGTVTLTFDVPEGITTDYFYQIYRTEVSTAQTLDLLSEVDPGDEMKLVIETAVTSADIAAGTITVQDITPQSFQQGGAFLYTNPISGEGILQANERPPVAKDIAIFKNSVFYANTRTRHALEVSLLGLGNFTHGNISNIVDHTTFATITSTAHGLTSGNVITIVGTGASLVDAPQIVTVIDANTFTIPVSSAGANPTTGTWFGSYLSVFNGTTTNRYFFVGRPEITAFTFDTQANTANGSYFNVYSANDLVHYAVWFDKTGTTTPPTVSGAVLIRVNISGVGSGTNVSPTVATSIEAATNDFNIVQTSSTVLTFTPADNGPTTNATAGSPAPGGTFAISVTQQGFGEDKTKNYVLLSGYVSPGQAIDDTARSLVRIINQNSSEAIYAYYLSGPTDIPGLMEFERRDVTNTVFTITANNSSVGSLFNPDLTTAATSSNETNPNRIYFSKFQQPEAVPIVNFLDIGPKDKEILRIVPLRDSLFIFKQEAIYRLTGDIAPNFSTILFDSSVHLIAPDTAAVLNNQIYSLTDGGIATVTETGVGIISRPIENVFKSVSTNNYPNFATSSFGIGYETERSYFVWTVTNTTDTYATQCFRYNTFTQCWTRWDKPQTCIVLNSLNNMIFVGSPTSNIVEVERKTLTRNDYADKEIALQVPSTAIPNSTTLTLSSVSQLVPGDAVVQTQYVTMNVFNSLLIKLDMDPRVGLVSGSFDTNYSATLKMIPGDSITNKMASLVAKLNADPGTNHGYVFDGSTNFATIQTEYNTMIASMNSDSKLKFTNYQTSSGTSNFEMTITAVNPNNNKVTGDNVPNLMVGAINAFKGIQSKVIWAPNSGGDPSLLKHYREATMLFETSAFRGGTVSYNSDLSPGFEPIHFNMDGSGVWGGFIWGATTWGGSGSSVPFRTYVPRQKQRCRYIRCQLTHGDAFYKYAVLGISYAFDVSSDRAYRGR